MGTMVLSSQDCLQNPLLAGAFRQPQPPPRSRRHRTGHRPRQTMTAAASPASMVAAHSPTTNPLPRRGCACPIRPRRRCRTPEDHRRMVVRRPMIKELVMGEVTALRRCPAAAEEEERNPVVPEGAAGDLELCSTKRLGPDPAKLPKRTRLMDQTKPQYCYAGSGFLITSPPPSSLPLPTSFLAKKVDAGGTADVATVALRCLLRLDLP